MICFFLIPVVGEILPFLFLFFIYSIKKYKLNAVMVLYIIILIFFSLYVSVVDIIKGAGIEVFGKLLYPILFFLVGVIFYDKYGREASANLKLNCSLSLLFFCILSMIHTLWNYGSYSDFTVNNGRVIYEFITNVKYSNTAINGFLSGSMVLFPLFMVKNNGLSKSKNFIVLLMGIISIYIGITLGNRSTFIMVFGVFILLIFICKFDWMKFIPLVALVAIYYLIFFNETILGKRMESDDGLDNSRLRNWIEGFEIIKQNFLIGSDLRTSDVFAHNFILDIAIPYGFFPALLLFLMLLLGLGLFTKFIFLRKKNFFSVYFVALFFGIFVIFLIEPVYQGLFKLYCFYSLIIGMGFSYFSKLDKRKNCDI